MSKKILNLAFFLEIIAGVLLYITMKELTISLLLILSGVLFLIAGYLFADNKKE